MDKNRIEDEYIKKDDEHAGEMVKALDNTGVRMFMYYPQTKSITVPEKTCAAYGCKPVYDNMPDSFAEDYVYQEDYAVFKEMYYKIDKGEKTATAVFHSKDLNYCNCVTLTTISWTENGTPNEVFGIIEDRSDAYKSDRLVEKLQNKLTNGVDEADDSIQEAVSLIADVISDSYITIYHIWPEDNTFICFQDMTSEFTGSMCKRVPCEPKTREIYIRDWVEPEYKETAMNFFDFETLQQRLNKLNTISYIYRRKKYGWTKGQYIVAKRDADGNAINVIFAVSDINAEKERDKKEQQAIYETMHDPMTKVYNRKGYDELLLRRKKEELSVGYAVVDVDNFKVLNDNYGHDVGDKVLIALANELKSIFKSEDKIFRMGGDEFAVLFHNCDATAWNTICTKIKKVHTHLIEEFLDYKDISITLSVGLCFSENGYDEKLSILADKALYETKKNGRAGCTLVDLNGNILKSWHDDRNIVKSQSVLEYNNTGLYRMEVPLDAEKPRQLICSEATKLLLGIPNEATPEECYQIWEQGIEPEYVDTLTEVRKEMIKGGQVECTYLWNHPKWGKIYVRSGGYGEVKDGIDIMYGYHHTLKDTKVIEHKDDRELLFTALSDMYISSYYLNLETNSFSTFKVAPGEDYLQMQYKTIEEITEEFINVIVAPKDRQKMTEFMRMDTLQQRMSQSKYLDCEYRSLVMKGWCQARFIPVKYNQEGLVTHILLVVSSLGKAKSKELDVTDYNKKSLSALFQHVPAGVVMYEWNGEYLRTLHISDCYAEQYGGSFLSKKGEKIENPYNRNIHPDDLEEFIYAYTKGINETHKMHHIFRVWNEKKSCYLWIRIDAVSDPQPDGNSLVYAIYTDVTDAKENELKLQKKQVSLEVALDAADQICCEYDPKTHIIECLTEDNYLNLPRKAQNFPNCMVNLNLVHSQDTDLLLETVHKADKGEKAHCDIRCFTRGEYRWYSCTFSPYYDTEKGRNIAIFSMYDITIRMESLKSYEGYLRSLLANKENTLSMCTINLTKNTFEMLGAENEMQQFIDENASFDIVMQSVVESIVGDEDKRKYRELMSRENLLKQAESGNMHVQIEYLLKMEENHYEWVTASVEMVKNPVTGDIGGVAYSWSSQVSRMTQKLLDRTLEQDYLFAASVFTDTDEFYMYNPNTGKYSSRLQNFWEVALKDNKLSCSKSELGKLERFFTKENVINSLKKETETCFVFDSQYNGKNNRLEIRFSYLDETKTMLLASMRNITDSDLLVKLRHESEHDSLTDLYNRKTLFRVCRRLLDEHPEDQFAMVHADMKHFHLFNTFFGDEAGDKLLCDVADMFRAMDEDYDYWAYGRIEADVFCVFIPYNQERYEKHLNGALEQLKNYTSAFLIEPVLGVYFVTDKSMSIESMFTRAGIASKTAKISKSSFPNVSVVYNDDMERKMVDEQQVVNDMQEAIINEQFKVYLQPKYSLTTNKPVGAEALVRWIHPEKGIVSPGKFIPVFEGNGFISELDRYMWEHVCMLIRTWLDEGKEVAPISVNVSRISMFNPSTVQFLKDLIKRYNIETRYLQLELTESAYIDDPQEMMFQMNALREAGFEILMDDFGSGYSSLNTVRDLPVDCLKLDMKFLSQEEDNRGNLVLTSIVQMSKLLNLDVIAEGVETKEQADFLNSIGCEYVQGYLFAKPMPVEDYEGLVYEKIK